MTYNKNNNIFKFMNISNIKSHFDNVKKHLLDFERKIITKVHITENKINKIKRIIDNNSIKIIQQHNNILDKTQIEYEIELYPLSLNFLNNNDYENAFANILGDDIYLIRLLIISRAHINELKVSKELFKKIIIRLNGINKSHFIENLIFESIQNIKPYIIINEQNYILGNDLINTMNDIKQYKNKNLQSKVNYFIKLIYNMYNNFNK
jgi:SOS-response transcriptional repressor LexA